MTAKTPTWETPFWLTYGNEAVIPAEIGLTSYRVDNHDKRRNDEAIRLLLDLVDEVRAIAEQRLTRYQDRMAKHYNSRVWHRDFMVGNLVLRKVMGAARDPTQGKLGPNWEGPYWYTSWQRKGTYHLETIDGQKLPHPWNTEQLRKYYQWKRWREEATPLYFLFNYSYTPQFLYFTLVFATITFQSPKNAGFCFLFKNYFFYGCMAIRGVYSENSQSFYR